MKFSRFLSRYLWLGAVLLASHAAADSVALLKLPDFDRLTEKASESVNISLSPALLGLAAGFLDSNDPDDAAVKSIIGGLNGIYVRSFKFESDYAYPLSDVEAVRKQLGGASWQRLVQVRNKNEGENVDIYMSVTGGKANGLAIIASEPREFTIVNIVGSVDLDKLHKLEGQFGIPKLDIDEKRSDATNRSR
jgi:hypothetical protein